MPASPDHSPSRLEEPDDVAPSHDGDAASYEAQVQQDLDAARAMSRGRASSTAGHSPVSARPIGVPTSASNTTPFNAAPAGRAYGASYLGGEVTASPPPASQQQQQRDMLSPNMGPSSPRRAFTAAGSSPAAMRHHHQQHHAAIAAEAAAARFYQHHRRAGSNESVDSASHFIDHRNSQSGLASYTPSPGAARMMQAGPNMPRSVGRATGAAGRSPRSAFAAAAAAANEHALMDDDEGEVDATFDNGRRRQASHLSPHAISPSQLRHGSSPGARGDGEEGNMMMPGTPHTMSRRPSMLEDDVCFPMTTPHDDQHAGEHGLLDQSHVEDHHHRHLDLDDEMDERHHHHDHHHPQERLPPGYPFTFDLSALEDFAVEERARIEATSSAAAAAVSNWSGLRNRPTAIAAAASAAARDVQGRTASGISTTGTAAGAQAYAVSPDSDDATFYSRRPRRFVPAAAASSSDAGALEAGAGAAGAAGTGRYQRKLALFEGGSATSPPPPAVGGRAATIAGEPVARNIMGDGALLTADAARAREANGGGAGADSKTPLLPTSNNNNAAPSYSAGTIPGSWEAATAEAKSPPLPRSQSMGVPLSARDRRKSAAASGFGASSAHHPALAEKPYRFTFYSNALPSTIHARHLAELPAPGQTFEELFSGFKQEEGNGTGSGGAGAGTPGANGKEAMGTPAGSSAAAEEGAAAAAAQGQGQQGRAPMRQASALAAQLGRMEGNTAPPTGANTPELVSAPLGGVASGAMSRGNTTARNSTAAPPQPPSAAQAQAQGRVIPGGGIRMDQDPEANTWWLDILSPTDQEMKLLSRVFGIHPLTTEDILMEETREKIELFRNYYLACFRSFDQDPYSPTYLEPLNMYIIVFREGTLSFHFRATPHPQNVRRRIKQLKDYINVTSDWISYALIDDITDAFGPLIQSIEYEVDSIDELVLILKEAEQSDMLRRIGTCRKKVMGLLRLMGNKADVVKGLAKRCNENWSVAPKSDIGLYLSDIQDHLITMTQNLNHYEKILSRSHSNYLAQISIEMTDANNQINDVLSKLTALGTVIVPMNVITGLWGMNVHVPGQDVANLNWFAGIVSFMVALAVVGYFATIRYLSR